MGYIKPKRKYSDIFEAVRGVTKAIDDLEETILWKYSRTGKELTYDELKYVLEHLADYIQDFIDTLSANFKHLMTKDQMIFTFLNALKQQRR